MSVPDYTVEVVVDPPNFRRQLLVVCVLEECVNLIYIHDVVLKLLVGNIRDDFLAYGVQAYGEEIKIKITQFAIVRQFLKALTMLVGEVPLVCQRHQLDLWMLLHIVLCMLCQHRVGLTGASATLYDDGIVVLICVIIENFLSWFRNVI